MRKCANGDRRVRGVCFWTFAIMNNWHRSWNRLGTPRAVHEAVAAASALQLCSCSIMNRNNERCDCYVMIKSAEL